MSMNVARVPWQPALFGCLSDPVECLLGFCCPCVLTYQMVAKAAPFTLQGLNMVIRADSAILWRERKRERERERE